MEKQVDFLAIGDITTNIFIKINEAEEKCDKEGENCKLCLNFGGKIPYESAEICHGVGNSPNAAVCASRLGLNSHLISYIGGDDLGEDMMETLVGNDVKIDFIEKVPGMVSNCHYILWYGVERTILVKHNEYPYSFPVDLPEPKWLYFSSLSANSLEYHKQINEYLKLHPDIKLVFQPGTFQIKMGVQELKAFYERAEIFICNKEEAQKILDTKESDEIELIKQLSALGPKITVLTNGLKGAYAYDGNDIWFIEVYPHEPLEKTGAGDSFSSTFAVALSLGKMIPEALVWAGINSMSVVQKIGPQAGLLTREKLEEFISTLPEDYRAKKIN